MHEASLFHSSVSVCVKHLYVFVCAKRSRQRHRVPRALVFHLGEGGRLARLGAVLGKEWVYGCVLLFVVVVVVAFRFGQGVCVSTCVCWQRDQGQGSYFHLRSWV
jgi:hypothetical protein